MPLTILPARSVSPAKLFLADGLGALLSALLLSGLLARWESLFGMPSAVAYGLSAVAAIFALYSGACHFWAKKHWRPCLRAIALANMMYAGLTIGLVGYFYVQIRIWGGLYFGGELLVIALLVRAEWRLLSDTTADHKQ